MKKSFDFGKTLIVVFGIMLGLLVLGSAWTFLSHKSYQTALNVLYKEQKLVEDWIVNSDPDTTTPAPEQSEDASVKLLEGLDKLSEKAFPSIAQMAYFLKGMIYVNKKDFASASVNFHQGYKKQKKSLVGVKAGLNAASSYENNDDIKNASLLYKQIAKQKQYVTFSQEARFHLGRLSEESNPVAALALYKELINKVEDGNFWRTLAENRSLLLEAKTHASST